MNYKFTIEIEAETKEEAINKIETFTKLDTIFAEKLQAIATMLEEKPELMDIMFELEGKSKTEIMASLPKIINRVSKIL